jgi:SAM-dependent methyltransferase
MTDTEGADLRQYLATLPQNELALLLKDTFGERVGLHIESSFPVTQSAFEKLSDEDVETIEEGIAAQFGGEVLAEVRRWKKFNQPHYRREILRYGCTVKAPLMESKTGMTSANPPPHIHSMIRNAVFAGDLYSGDMVAAAALRAGLCFENGRNYLDFGCSSGAVVRNVAVAFPRAHWHGCDPVPESVAWASQHFPQIAFLRSDQEPPLPFQDGYFHGIYASSVWSHFSERASLRWFDEVHRALEPGGFLIFTTHGYRSVRHHLEHETFTQDILGSILADLMNRQYAFHALWQDPSQEYGLHVFDWGMAYFTIEWVTRSLYRKFRVVNFQPGLSQMNQDVYVLLARV